MDQHITIAIDGPSGSGKSSVAKIVSEKLGILHLNTGSMYRMVALYFLRNKLDYNDPEIVENNIKDINIEVKYENNEQADYLNGEFVSNILRTDDISTAASVVSQFSHVREKAVAIQKAIAKKISVIMEGRDIGTVVLPDSKNKFFLTATSEERAKRRYKQNLEMGISCEYEKILQDVKDRDVRDTTRSHSPLKQADDAIYIDSTNMTIDQVVNFVISHLKH